MIFPPSPEIKRKIIQAFRDEAQRLNGLGICGGTIDAGKDDCGRDRYPGYYASIDANGIFKKFKYIDERREYYFNVED